MCLSRWLTSDIVCKSVNHLGIAQVAMSVCIPQPIGSGHKLALLRCVLDNQSKLLISGVEPPVNIGVDLVQRQGID